MKFFLTLAIVLTGSLFLCAPFSALADTTFIKYGTAWKYLDDGSNQGTAWRATKFADGNWASGPSSFGYGDEQRTTVSFGTNAAAKYITTYFRTTVKIASPSQYSGFKINMYVDDAAVVYINGKEQALVNITTDPAYDQPATAAAAENGHAIQSFSIPAGAFSKGVNSIAVEVHQEAAGGKDMVFDFELAGITSKGEPAITRGPLLQMANGNSMTIRWTTETATTSRIKYGTADNALTKTITDNKPVTEHEIRINGLTPDTKYFYAAGSAKSLVKGSYRNYFTTAPPANTTRKIRIGVFGDPGKGDALQKSTRDAYIHLKNAYNTSELAIMLGDNAYNAGTQIEHQLNFFNIYNDNIFTNHIVLPVPGNHEYGNDRSTVLSGNMRYTLNIPYYGVFTLPTAGESGGLPSGTEQYYSADYGNIHFIMLDSYGYTPDPTAPGDFTKYTRLFDDTTNGAQAVWLKKDLAANAGKHKWTVVCLHHPPYTNGTHASNIEKDLIAIRQNITPILERYGVDIVLAGHSHVYERSFLIEGHTGFSTPFNDGTPGAGTKVSTSSARYDGSSGNTTTDDYNAATTSCPYFTIDSTYKHGTVYVVAGSAGQVGGGTNPRFPMWYYKNYSGSKGGEVGALYLEVQDNRMDAKFVGGGGSVHDQFTIMKGVNKNTIVKTAVNQPATLTASWVGGYNWYSTKDSAITAIGKERVLALTPSKTGTFTYYVSDSLLTEKTCITDTFQLQVTSTMALSVSNYKAVLKNKKVLVDWVTSKEINSDYFTVEKSADGQNYEMAMVIPGKENAPGITNYEFIDNDPLPGKSYYRLIATGKNGDRKVAGVQSISNSSVITPSATGTF